MNYTNTKKSLYLRRVFDGVLLVFLMVVAFQPVAAGPNCDADNDGYGKNNRHCPVSTSYDCTDSDPSINPGAIESCGNGTDDNCNGEVDEGCSGSNSLICQDGIRINESCSTNNDCGGVCVGGTSEGNFCNTDSDCPPNKGKGSLKGRCKLYACILDTGTQCTDTDEDGYAREGGDCGPVDCNDNNGTIHPGATELCGDLLDNNCDGQVDEECPIVLPNKIAAAGDSITQAFAADCNCNTSCPGCLLDGDQPEHSWFDGSSSRVFSVHDRYLGLDGSVASDKSAAADGSQMRGGSNSFAVQAQAIVRQVPIPEHVEVELGGNDLCGRDCIDPTHCSDPVYTDSQWRASVREGLDVLVNGLPDGSTVYLLGVPRVQDLRAAGLAKRLGFFNLDCEGVWDTFDICTIATQDGSYNGESLTYRLTGLAERQKRYNEILKEEAVAYNANTTGQNPRRIEVLADYVDENTDSVGTFRFGADDINGGDCFHPSTQGQSTIADKASRRNPDLVSP